MFLPRPITIANSNDEAYYNRPYHLGDVGRWAPFFRYMFSVSRNTLRSSHKVVTHSSKSITVETLYGLNICEANNNLLFNKIPFYRIYSKATFFSGFDT